MNRLACIVVLILLFAAPSIATAQSGAGQTPGSSDTPVAKLREDLKRAVKNGSLTDAQKNKMQSAATALREAAQARQNGEKVDRGAVRKSFGDVKEIVNSGAFQPEDQKAVKADLEAVKEKVQKAKQGRGLWRRGLFRQF